MQKEFIFTELYRPKTVEECILPQKTKEMFLDFVKKKEIPNMILHGSSGVGKTTVAQALCRELNCEFLKINASEERNIDTLRTKIKGFASSVSMNGNTKVVILDEADYLNCLEENEEIAMADGSYMTLKDFSLNEKYEVKSFNPETKKFENDVAEVVKIAHKETYEVEMEDGRTIQVTADHPFMVVDAEGKISERTINDGFEGYEIISV